MKRPVITIMGIICVVLLVVCCVNANAAEKPISYGMNGGVGFTSFFNNTGGYYGINSFIRIDSAKNLWARAILARVDAFGAKVKVGATSVLKFPLIKNLDCGFVVGGNYDFGAEQVEGLYGFEFEWCPLYAQDGYEKITITPSFNVVEVEGINYSTLHLFINFTP